MEKVETSKKIKSRKIFLILTKYIPHIIGLMYVIYTIGEFFEYDMLLLGYMFTLTESADYIEVYKNTFNNYVDKGLIPKGIKRIGTNSLFWNRVDLDKYLKNKKK